MKAMIERTGFIEQIDKPILENLIRRLLKKELDNCETLCISKNPPFGQIGTFKVEKPHPFREGDRVRVTIDPSKRKLFPFSNAGIVSVQHLE